ncbi:MAG: SUMF1/EgtB/PvdO family nonheme iron enzyme [Acidobacteriota bacterium]
MSIRTTPAGARVYMTGYRAPEGNWHFLGVSPIEQTRIPLANLRFRIEKAGYQTLEGTQYRGGYPPVIEFTLQRENERPGMIHVPGGTFQFWSVPAPRVDPYWMDRYEVTNRQFKKFVEQGGYRERRLWAHPIVLEGRVVPWEEAITSFVDRTGRPGPSAWELGTFPDGKGDFPVGGISWHEAAAYCEYAGHR